MDFETSVKKAADSYRSRYEAGDGRVHWNKEGAEDVKSLAREAAKAGVPKKSLAEAAGVAYGTLRTWLESPDYVAKPRANSAKVERPLAGATSSPSHGAETSKITFDIERLPGGGYRVSLSPHDIRVFLQSI